MNNIKLNGSGETTKKAYENEKAHDVLVSIIERKEKMTISFFTDKEGYSSVGIESARTAWFKYRINNNSFNSIINYLDGKEVDLSKINPNQADIYQAIEDGLEDDFSTYVFKQLVEAGYQVQVVPLFRSVYGYVNAVVSPIIPRRGKIVFRMNRTDSLLDYLTDKKLI